MILDVLEVEITRTADGRADYVQLRSPAAAGLTTKLAAALPRTRR